MNADEAIKALLLQGKKIQAIKELRETQGLGLTEAKERVDGLERELIEAGEMEPRAKTGCGAGLLLFGVGLAGAAYWVQVWSG